MPPRRSGRNSPHEWDQKREIAGVRSPDITSVLGRRLKMLGGLEQRGHPVGLEVGGVHCRRGEAAAVQAADGFRSSGERSALLIRATQGLRAETPPSRSARQAR